MPPTRSIPFYNVLWASLNDFDLTIHHAHSLSNAVVRVACISYPIDKSDRSEAAEWVERLLIRAYGASQRRKRIKVLVNPFGGKGSAQKWFLRDIEPIFSAAQCAVDVERTQYKGHAIEIAENLDVNAYDVVASCSGDGLPHEVFNGLGHKKDATRALSNVAVVQLPCGTGNAMSINLNGTNSPSLAALAVVKGLRTPMDLVSVTQGENRTLSFLSQAVGIVAESDLGTENLRWLGDARFTYGFLVRLLGKITYPCEVAVKVTAGDKPSVRELHRDYVNTARAPEAASTSSVDLLSPAGENHKVADDTEARLTSDESLPALRYGTVLDQLPSGWHLVPYPTIGNFYAGNMAWMAPDHNFFQAALPSDGCLDLVCVGGDISRINAIRCLLAVGKGTFFDMPNVNYRKVEAYRIIPQGRAGGGWAKTLMSGITRRKNHSTAQKQGCISIDGERAPFEPFQVEVHRGLGLVLSRTGKIYEAPLLQ